MKNKKVCRIVDDLLLNYIEGFTNEVTNQFVGEHLKGCASCLQKKQKMTDNIENKKVVHNQQKEIDYMKKYRRKLNILKSIIGIIIIVEMLFLGNLCRKFYIINQFKSQMEQGNPDNYYVKLIDNNDGNFSESWTKGEKTIRKSINHIAYTDSKQAWIIISNDKENIAIKVNREKFGTAAISIGYNSIPTDNLRKMLQYTYTSSITSEVYGGVECYRIYKSQYEQIYINKKDFKPIRIINGDTDYSYEYTLNEVTEEQVQFTNITGYEIRDDSNK